ncbi:MAG: dihydroneopterin aldolase [bacterium]|nr:dihydroneopterin aldolase [bacterium]
MGKIYIRNLELACIIGCKPEERLKKRTVNINIELVTDLSKPARTDRIEDAVDYQRVADLVEQLVSGTEFNLLERLTEDICNKILNEFDVSSVRVCTGKPGALKQKCSVAVEMERSKKTV